MVETFDKMRSEIAIAQNILETVEKMARQNPSPKEVGWMKGELARAERKIASAKRSFYFDEQAEL